MFRKVLYISAMMLLLASYSTNAMKMDCGTMTPEDCKMELGMQMDKMTMMKMIEMLKMEMTKIKKLWTDIMRDMPADSMHVKTIMEAMDRMDMEMTRMEKMGMMDMMKMMKMDMMKMMDMWSTMKGDMPTDNMNVKKMMEMMERMKMRMDMGCMEKMDEKMDMMDMMKDKMQDFFMSMHPNFKTAQMEDTANNAKFEEVMKKHGSPDEKMADDFMMMITELEKMWMEMMSGLRDEDMKKYPEYTEMRDMMKTMREETNKDKRMEMFVKMMTKMVEFYEAPFMKAMMMAIAVKNHM